MIGVTPFRVLITLLGTYLVTKSTKLLSGTGVQSSSGTIMRVCGCFQGRMRLRNTRKRSLNFS